MKTKKDLEFEVDILLGRSDRVRELRGRQFGRYIIPDTGVADSVQAVQEANLLQVPPYAIIAGKGVAAKEETTWKTIFIDTLGEQLTLDVKAGQYDGIDAGVYVVDLIGAGLFMPRHDVIRAAVKGNKLVNGAIKIEPKYKDLLLKEKRAYRWNGREVKKVSVQVFDSYDAFLEASTGTDFVQGLRDMTAVYAVIRPVDKARENQYQHTDVQSSSSDYPYIRAQLNYPDGIILSGGEAPWQKMLHQMMSLDMRSVRYNLGCNNYIDIIVDGCRHVVLDCGIDSIGCFGFSGGSVGVAPEALRAWNNAHDTANLNNIL